MDNSTKMTKVVGGLSAILASVIMIVVANMLIARYIPDFGDSVTINALVIISYVMIVVAVICKLCSIVLIVGKYPKYMAALVIITQLILIALEISTVVMWMGMGMLIGALDIIFMVLSVLSILLAIVYLVKIARIINR